MHKIILLSYLIFQGHTITNNTVYWMRNKSLERNYNLLADTKPKAPWDKAWFGGPQPKKVNFDYMEASELNEFTSMVFNMGLDSEASILSQFFKTWLTIKDYLIENIFIFEFKTCDKNDKAHCFNLLYSLLKKSQTIPHGQSCRHLNFKKLTYIHTEY